MRPGLRPVQRHHDDAQAPPPAGRGLPSQAAGRDAQALGAGSGGGGSNVVRDDDGRGPSIRHAKRCLHWVSTSANSAELTTQPTTYRCSIRSYYIENNIPARKVSSIQKIRKCPPPPHQTSAATASAATASNRACSSCKLQVVSIRYALHTTT